MAEIVNLRRARKARLRDAAQTEAATNRVVHGQTLAAKRAAKADAEKLRMTLDGAKREP
jgi:hypothetical protein